MRTTILALGMVLAAGPAVAESAADPAIIGATCSGCHGPDGVGSGAIPPLAGLPAATIEEALKAFKAGSRSATVMTRLAKGYSDEEIRALGAYFAAIK